MEQEVNNTYSENTTGSGDRHETGSKQHSPPHVGRAGSTASWSASSRLQSPCDVAAAWGGTLPQISESDRGGEP